ncbi:glucose-1-phosphate adenylyltransferase [Desulforhopalus singaporensis]|uniref:Glucose-1-phosphate adenylyltransferase n=1 Tax=Desulforhopalus singaporensis TaxID=91360 RepID=A0A1H0SNY1_9BACT|nr:glucose-1-phosphate adenylyltransferase [Desulforhopalus singaporensis]SDP43427.1 glucose-1-phosphate adenylyltransferase [Desulforhopalus singaporensis]
MQNRTLTFILAGGVGSRLLPLTLRRSKPAVPFGGKYRIIDFTLANCLHSGLRRVLVLTQYKSHSLHKHLRDGWSIFNPELGEYITAVPAQMNYGDHWYEGTADAVFQNLNLIDRSDADFTLILSGDHIYRMDYEALLRFHKDHGGDVTVACIEVAVERAKDAFGVAVTNEQMLIVDYKEKPKQPTPIAADPNKTLASMGLYVFPTKLLKQVLLEDQYNTDSSHDLAKDVLPVLVQNKKVYAYKFGGKKGRVTQDRYWRDVGTIDAYYKANMDLLEPVPPLNLYQVDWPIRTYQPQTPPARIVPGTSGAEGVFISSMLASGVVVSGGNVRNSVLFEGIFIDDRATIDQSILFAGVQVGAEAALRNCIVDKNVKIPPQEQIGYDLTTDRHRFTVTEQGIVVVPEGFVFG